MNIFEFESNGCTLEGTIRTVHADDVSNHFYVHLYFECLLCLHHKVTDSISKSNRLMGVF